MAKESNIPVRTPLKLRTEPRVASTASSARPWKLLVVDDEEGVHAVTRVALSELRYRDRPLVLLTALSAQQALQILREESDIAICLLDVVMEHDDAGLKLVETIRNELDNQAIRIILRTGQPGQAPEQRVILDYDINDYKAKSELSAQRLFTSVVSALRSYETIMELQRHRNGLLRILDQSDALFTAYGIKDFASVVLDQLSAFLDCQPDGVLCAHPQMDALAADGDHHPELVVVAAVGEYSDCNGCRLDNDCEHHDLLQVIREASTSRRSQFTENMTVLYLDHPQASTLIVLRHAARPVTAHDRELLEIYVSKVKLAMQSVIWHEQLLVAEQAATTDFLTGLTNRRHLMHLGTMLLAGARRRQLPMVVAMVDIDHFKLINDALGHAAGDVALKHLADLLRRRFRQSDVVARYGGEEFCIIVPDSNLNRATELLEDLRSAVERYIFHVGDVARQMTISIGVAASDENNCDDLEALIARADLRLYAAKQGGRNRLVWA